MAHSTYEVKLGSIKLENLLAVDGFKVEPNKLWLDANRNLAGELKATFLGVYPKISLEFIPMEESDLKPILVELAKPVISVEYWDAELETYKTANYYAGDFSYPLFSRTLGLYSGFSVNLIPYKKRS